MRSRLYFAVALSALVLSGCYTAVATVATLGMEKSKYRPLLITLSDVDTWESNIKSANRQVVKDELGTYYFDTKPDGVYGAYLAAKDGQVLRNLFSGEIGLLEPIYIQDDNLAIRPDWKETERRHDYLTRTIKLKLLPLSASRKYHELVEQKVRADGYSVSVSDALSGNLGLYDDKYYANVVQKVPGKYSYFIGSPFGSSNYYFTLQSQMISRDARSSGQRESRPDNQSPMSYRGAAKNIRTGYMLHFGLVDVFKSIQRGGISYLAMSSNCGFINIQEQRKMIQSTSDMVNVPYVSAIGVAVKERDAEELRKARAEYFGARSEAMGIMRKHEVACLGLREIGVAGRIGSEKLD